MKTLSNNQHWIWLIFFIFNLTTGYGQISFKAKTSSKTIVSGSYFTVEFELKNARGVKFEPPVFRGFSVISGPSSSTSTTIINGRRTSSVSYSYNLMAEEPGRYIISSAIIRTNKQINKSFEVISYT